MVTFLSRFLPILCVWFLSIMLAFFWFATSKGIGVTTDSVTYYWGARSIYEHNGYRYPEPWGLVDITRWPPFYSAVLALWMFVAGVSWSGVFVLHAVFLALVLSLFWLLLQTEHKKQSPFVLLVLVIYGASPSLLPVATMAWSEPLYLVILFGFLLSLWQYMKFGRPVFIMVSAILAAAGALTKYVGASLIFAGFACVLWKERHSVVLIFKRAVVFFCVSFTPLYVWLIYSGRDSQQFLGRIIGWHPPPSNRIVDALAVLGSWASFGMPFLPSGSEGQYIFSGLLTTILIVLLVYFWVRKRSSFGLLFWLCVVMTVSYIGVYIVGVNMFDASAEVDFRTMAPVYPLLLYIVSILLRHFVLSISNRGFFISFWLIMSVYVVSGFISLTVWASYVRERGLGANRWLRDSVVSFVSTHYTDKEIYSNRPKIVRYFYEEASHKLPTKHDPISDVVNEGFGQEYEQMRELFAARQAVLIFFPLGYNEEFYYPSESFLVSDLGLKQTYNQGEIRVYEKQ